ncbi:protein-tyrosine phosphatase family protein [Desulfococcaceae bacterium HSG8]|nr:protein-tyrosine phosphatase family protein [Desulfococcaceae bacterium HSG8]
MQKQQPRPIDYSYWIEPGRVLAGEYPQAFDEEELRAGMRSMLKAGVTFFLNLTEENERRLEPYHDLLKEEAVALEISAEHCRMPIRDFQTTSAEHMKKIIQIIDNALAAGHKVYIHCFAGIGRTGMTAGCYLASHGRSGEEALDKLARMKQGTPFEDSDIPVTYDQQDMVKNWGSGKD